MVGRLLWTMSKPSTVKLMQPSSKIKASHHPKVPSCCLLLVPLQLRRSSPSLSRKIAVSVVNKVTSLWITTYAQRILTRFPTTKQLIRLWLLQVLPDPLSLALIVRRLVMLRRTVTRNKMIKIRSINMLKLCYY
jgi:hypothetical protein